MRERRRARRALKKRRASSRNDSAGDSSKNKTGVGGEISEKNSGGGDGGKKMKKSGSKGDVTGVGNGRKCSDIAETDDERPTDRLDPTQPIPRKSSIGDYMNLTKPSIVFLPQHDVDEPVEQTHTEVLDRNTLQVPTNPYIYNRDDEEEEEEEEEDDEEEMFSISRDKDGVNGGGGYHSKTKRVVLFV